MNKRKIVSIDNGEILLMERKWWEIYKKGWDKHRDFWNRMLWKKNKK